jgi:hypothetical protein
MNKLHDIVDEIPPIKQPMRYVINNFIIIIFNYYFKDLVTKHFDNGTKD